MSDKSGNVNIDIVVNSRIASYIYFDSWWLMIKPDCKHLPVAFQTFSQQLLLTWEQAFPLHLKHILLIFGNFLNINKVCKIIGKPMKDMTRTCFLNTTGSGTRNPPLAIFTFWGNIENYVFVSISKYNKFYQIVKFFLRPHVDNLPWVLLGESVFEPMTKMKQFHVIKRI